MTELNPMVILSADIPEQAREWRNDPSIYGWCRQHTLISVSEHQSWLDKIGSDKTIKMFGIEADQKQVGVCGFTSINMLNKSAEFSLYIAKHHQGFKYGEKALLCLLSHGFNNFGFNRIWGEVFSGNPAIKTFERCGMKLEGTLRESNWKNGKFIDSHIYSILCSDWFNNCYTNTTKS